MADHSDDDWTPPTAADLKIIEARQERSNQISKLMGTYMLKGYRMLDTVCHCGTILLQNREGVDYCVACNELETECAKDDPALSTEAARVAVLESKHSGKSPLLTPQPSAPVDRLTLYGIENEPVANPPQPTVMSQARGDEMTNQNAETVQGSVTLPSIQNNIVIGQQFLATSTELKNQLNWATQELKSSSSVEQSIQLCNLIKACSEALVALHKAEQL